MQMIIEPRGSGFYTIVESQHFPTDVSTSIAFPPSLWPFSHTFTFLMVNVELNHVYTYSRYIKYSREDQVYEISIYQM